MPPVGQDVATESGHLHRFAFDSDTDRAVLDPDRVRTLEQLANPFGAGVGGYVPIADRKPEDGVADAAADRECRVTSRSQPPDDLEQARRGLERRNRR
jgi:hypothetical protein